MQVSYDAVAFCLAFIVTRRVDLMPCGSGLELAVKQWRSVGSQPGTYS